MHAENLSNLSPKRWVKVWLRAGAPDRSRGETKMLRASQLRAKREQEFKRNEAQRQRLAAAKALKVERMRLEAQSEGAPKLAANPLAFVRHWKAQLATAEGPAAKRTAMMMLADAEAKLLARLAQIETEGEGNGC